MTQTLRVPQTPQSPEILCKGGAQRSRFLRGSDCTGVLTLSSSSDFHFFQEQKAVFRTKQNHFQRKPSLLAPCRAHTTSGTVPAMRRRGRAGWPRGRAELGQAGHTCFSLPTTHGWQWDPLRALGRPLPTLWRRGKKSYGYPWARFAFSSQKKNSQRFGRNRVAVSKHGINLSPGEITWQCKFRCWFFRSPTTEAGKSILLPWGKQIFWAI